MSKSTANRAVGRLNTRYGVREVANLIAAIGTLLTNSATGVSLAVSNTAYTVVSLALPDGQWDVDGMVVWEPAATTTITAITGGLSLVNNTFGALGTYTHDSFASFTPGAGIRFSRNAPIQRFVGPTTAYLIGRAAFGTSTITADGFIRAVKAAA